MNLAAHPLTEVEFKEKTCEGENLDLQVSEDDKIITNIIEKNYKLGEDDEDKHMQKMSNKNVIISFDSCLRSATSTK